MEYYIGIDTQDLDDPYGKGAMVVYTKGHGDRWIIINTFESMNRESFTQELERIKQKYTPHIIQEWN